MGGPLLLCILVCWEEWCVDPQVPRPQPLLHPLRNAPSVARGCDFVPASRCDVGTISSLTCFGDGQGTCPKGQDQEARTRGSIPGLAQISVFSYAGEERTALRAGSHHP